MAVEFRDEDTGAHIERIGRFSTLLAEAIGMEEELCERMVHAAPLHDVGKVAIPDAILLKPAALTAQERAIVETHAEEGHRLLKGSSSAILDLAATIALSHHEKWDGSGYPRGVAGEAIPIEGRIVAIADVFDALTCDRVYRKAFTVEKAVEMMRFERGRHFDPVLLDAFLEVLGSSGPDAREHVRADPIAVADSALETFVTALERSDAEMAEGAVAQAIEDGVAAVALPGEVIEPALRRIAELREQGEIDAEREQAAIGIARRVLATLRRYILGRQEEPRALTSDRRVDRDRGGTAGARCLRGGEPPARAYRPRAGSWIDFRRMAGTAIVTGGAGFIGSHVVDSLLADGYEVTVIDDLSSGSASRVAAGARLVELDIVDAAGVSASSRRWAPRRSITWRPRRAWLRRCRTRAATAR